MGSVDAILDHIFLAQSGELKDHNTSVKLQLSRLEISEGIG